MLFLYVKMVRECYLLKSDFPVLNLAKTVLSEIRLNSTIGENLCSSFVYFSYFL